MFCNVLCIEHTVVRPQPALGDAAMSPTFNRVSAVCPVLSLFGHISCAALDGDGDEGGAGATAPSTAPSATAAAGRALTACVHVHGCYPYFLAPQYDASVSAVEFGAQLEAVALQTLFQPAGAPADGAGRRVRRPAHGQLLHDVELVRRVPFYGYHEHSYWFYRVSVIDPGLVGPLTQLLQETTRVGGRAWQLYEAHTPYHTQFTLDHEIKGTTPFRLPACHLRAPVLDAQLRGQSPAWMRRHLGVVRVLRPDEMEGRRTRAALELDVAASALRPSAEAAAAPGSHLLHVRRLVKEYFREHGVDDGLRTRHTIAAETDAQEAWRLGRLDPSAASDLVPRYGSVTLIQRCDPVACGLRRQMLAILRGRMGIADPEDTVCEAAPKPVRKRKVEWAGPGAGAAGPVKDPSYLAPTQATAATTQELLSGFVNPPPHGVNEDLVAALAEWTSSSSASSSPSPSRALSPAPPALSLTPPVLATAGEWVAWLVSSRCTVAGNGASGAQPSACDVVLCLAVGRVAAVTATSVRLQWAQGEPQRTVPMATGTHACLAATAPRAPGEDEETEDLSLGKLRLGTCVEELPLSMFATHDAVPLPVGDAPIDVAASSAGCRHLHGAERILACEAALLPPTVVAIHSVVVGGEERAQERGHRSMVRLVASSRRCCIVATQAHVAVLDDNDSDEEEEEEGGAHIYATARRISQQSGASRSSDRSSPYSTRAPSSALSSPSSDVPPIADAVSSRSSSSNYDADNTDGGPIASQPPCVRCISTAVWEALTTAPSAAAQPLTAFLAVTRSPGAGAVTDAAASSGGRNRQQPPGRSAAAAMQQQTALTQYGSALLRRSGGESSPPPPWSPLETAQPNEARGGESMEGARGASVRSDEPLFAADSSSEQPSQAGDWQPTHQPARPSTGTQSSVVYVETRHPPPAAPAVVVSRCGADMDGIPRPFTVTPTAHRTLRVSAALHHPKSALRCDDTAPAPPSPPQQRPAPGGDGSGGGRSRSRSTNRRHFEIASLRVLYVEVVVRCGGVVAVALGSTETHRETLAAEVICIRPPPTPAAPRAAGAPCMDGGNVGYVEVDSEAALLAAAVRAMRRRDPDLILSWEGYKYGLGLLALRYRVVTGRSLGRDLARLDSPALPTQPAAGTAESASQAQRRSSGAAGDALSVEEPSDADDEEDGDGDGDGGNDTAALPDGEGEEARAVRYAKRFGAVVRVPGRVCRSLGKDLRKAISLPSYTLAMVHQHVLGSPLPYFTDATLAGLCASADPSDRFLALSHLVGCVVATHRVALRTRYYRATAEFSAMLGILFEEVLSRGSQFRVEATLARMARPLGYAMLSPTRGQVFRQPRIQQIPLILQPRSGFYGCQDPVVVLDFRSLYPSIAVAYNLCYTTCVGMVQPNSRSRLGVVAGYRQRTALLWELLPDSAGDGGAEDGAPAGGEAMRGGDQGITATPNGALFVTPRTRRGVLPAMLEAVLDTRFEVQAAIQHVARPGGDAEMADCLHERQQALKMLANTTYGYTAASYTGRMPCVDLAEAIVSLGRQTLERAIALIHATERWRAEVVYGDTDSVFVRLGGGRTKDEAFDIGEEMARAVTASNPVPVQLQFEKVLSPCLLVVKKRYVGYAWQRRGQTSPVFLDKGIETVRRDQCPATARIARRLITHLFDSERAGVNVRGEPFREAMKQMYHAEVGLLLSGEGNPADYVFRRAVKLGRYRNDSHLPLAAHLALRRMEKDLLSTPYWGERLPYAVVRSSTATRLPDMVAHPEALLHLRSRATLDAEYYIRRHINSTLDRIFYLVGVSFSRWYQHLPRRLCGRRPSLLHAAPRAALMAPLMAERLHHLLQHIAGDGEGCASAAAASTPSVVWVGSSDSSADEQGPPHRADDDGAPLPPAVGRKTTLDDYYPSTHCIICNAVAVPAAEQLAPYTAALRRGRMLPRGTAPPSDESLAMALPPICAACVARPQALLAAVRRHAWAVGQQLEAIHATCSRCMLYLPPPDGTAADATLPDIEALVVARASGGPSRLRTAAIASPAADPEEAAEGARAGTASGENTFGCSSVDCRVNFTKRRVTVLHRQLQLLLQYIEDVVCAA